MTGMLSNLFQARYAGQSGRLVNWLQVAARVVINGRRGEARETRGDEVGVRQDKASALCCLNTLSAHLFLRLRLALCHSWRCQAGRLCCHLNGLEGTPAPVAPVSWFKAFCFAEGLSHGR